MKILQTQEVCLSPGDADRRSFWNPIAQKERSSYPKASTVAEPMVDRLEDRGRVAEAEGAGPFWSISRPARIEQNGVKWTKRE